jgi:hypothetical protein
MREMGIQKDAGEILALLYKDKIKGNGVKQGKEIENETGWEKIRIHNALEYLIGKELIDGKSIKGMGSSLTIFVHNRGMTAYGIDIIEDQEKFKGTFGIGFDLGIFNFSWQSK